MIPEEDLGPVWLRDYGFTDFGDIAADIDAMEKFGSELRAEVAENYAPHMREVSQAMMTRLPEVAGHFQELSAFRSTHEAVQDATHANVYDHANGTTYLATAAQEIGAEYRNSDAFSRARVSDVERAFERAAAPEMGSSGSDAGETSTTTTNDDVAGDA
ncbi:hypothetical protein [Mangrovihabitans endophyticus]|uniref:Uncharacterized protein n=1 Tax=Mangrovihabitans endophyticus TaxID=1751298 RepID=A0A8J3FQN4_9ACTN|nr:hypothetical protein [Mangrovihabitans endophyticus]GGL08584.1 hypothetical protein GCM10012284_48990 [Mangrovihabitans endophyticus]